MGKLYYLQIVVVNWYNRPPPFRQAFIRSRELITHTTHTQKLTLISATCRHCRQATRQANPH